MFREQVINPKKLINAAVLSNRFFDCVDTGASRGLGKAIALELGENGATIVLIGRDEAKLRETAALAGAEAHIFVTNVTQEPEVRALAEKIQSRFHHVDILINNAGVMLRKPLVEVTTDEWRNVISHPRSLHEPSNTVVPACPVLHCGSWNCRQL